MKINIVEPILEAERAVGEGGRYLRPWSPTDDDVLRHYVTKGYYASECAKMLKRTRNAVLGRAMRLGLHFQRRDNKKIPGKHYP